MDQKNNKICVIQTCGGYNPDDGYSFSIAFGNGPCMTLDGLTKEDIYQIASCALCMLPDEEYRTLLSSGTDLN
jgi:hypothetical protein